MLLIFIYVYSCIYIYYVYSLRPWRTAEGFPGNNNKNDVKRSSTEATNNNNNNNKSGIFSLIKPKRKPVSEPDDHVCILYNIQSSFVDGYNIVLNIFT